MKLEDVIQRGTRAAQPAIADVATGTIYYVTDETVLERSNGVAWQSLSASVVTPGITQLTGDVTAGPGTGSQAATVPNNTITYAKLQDISATARILARKTAAAGDVEEATLSEILDFIGSATRGDILYRGAATWARLAKGTAGQILTQGANDPAWGNAPSIVFSRGITVTGIITTGLKGIVRIPVACTITRWSIMADVVGSIQFDIFKSAPGTTYPPSTSIVSAAPPKLISDNFDDNATLTGWTTSVAAGDVLGFSVTSVATIARATLQLDFLTS